MKKMLMEFKDFIMKGNVVDMAVGIVIGVAFGKIVTSLVNDIIMPPIGLLLGKVDFKSLYINLSGQTFTSLDAAQAAGAPTINYGLFLSTVLDFIIVAFVRFLVIHVMSRIKKPLVKTPELTTKACPYCVSTIPLKATRCPNCTSELDK
jgi:large conductance mechanosensitive channel